MKTKKVWSLLLTVILAFMMIVPGFAAFAVEESYNIAGEEKSDIYYLILLSVGLNNLMSC